MIVELFGPPCVGKTTVARAVAARLRESGRSVKLVLSYRPSEYVVGAPSDGGWRSQVPAAIQRLARPIGELIRASTHPTDPNLAGAAVALTPLKTSWNVLQSLKLRQYLTRLARTWVESDRAADVILFDQGFVQAVYSSLRLTRAVDARAIGFLLDIVPPADLLVRLDAPIEVLKGRLFARRRQQTRLERVLDASTTLADRCLFDRIHEALTARDRAVIFLSSGCPWSLDEIVDKVEATVSEVAGQTTGRLALAWRGSR